MNQYDVIIIGAGPAGLKCAEVLGSSDKKILLLEKNHEIGPKICAGGLTFKSIEKLNLDSKIIDKEHDEVILHSPLAKNVVKKDYTIASMVDRKVLGQWLLKKISHKVEIRLNAQVTEISKDFVIVNNEEKVYYKYLVGADGSLSVVRRYLGLITSKFGVAVQYIIPTDKYKSLEVFFSSKYFNFTCGWIFPHKNFVSIGCGCDPHFTSVKKMVDNFNFWLKKKNIDVTNAEFQSFMINCDYQGYKFDNIFLVGDAAGFASYLSGEGIYEAIVSGEEVAKEILSPNYVSRDMEKLVLKKKRQDRLTNLLKYSGVLRNFIFEIIIWLLRNTHISDVAIKKL